VLIFEGEAGIGKTRLVDETIDLCGDNVSNHISVTNK
jgi:predicted ATPase